MKDNFKISNINKQNYIILVVINILLILSLSGVVVENKAETINSLTRFKRLCQNTAIWLLIVFILKIYNDYTKK
jgi:hypothetical protein